MLTTEKLREYGADVESGVRRCVDDEAFYLRMVRKSLDDEHYDRLKGEIEAGTLDRAMDTVVALQGMTGNLALSPIYEPLCALAKNIHWNQGAEEAASLAARILRQRDLLRALDEA